MPALADAPPPAAPAGDAGKFKLKPKAPLPAPPTIVAAPPPEAPPVAPPAGVSAVTGAAPPPAAPPPPFPVAKAPPPFPVVAPKAPPPVPHVRVQAEVPEPEKPAAVKSGRKRPALLAAGVAVGLIAAVGGYVGVKKFLAPPPPSARKAPSPGAPAAKAPATPPASPPAAAPTAPAASAPQSTPSETLNDIAHAPANAINKAQDAIAARRASGQSRVDAAAGEELADKPAAPADPTKKTVTARTSVAPGLSASTQVEAAVEASPAFLSFVTNAKVSGVVATRAIVNGRLVRAGEVVDAGLGIRFEGYDPDKKQLLFKDNSGATAVRRYP